MKYQKSMMKIIEYLLTRRCEESFERIIKGTKTGRNSAFEAINWLHKNGMVKIKKNGNQNLVSLIIDNDTLKFKYYLDSIEYKKLDPFVKLISGVFVSGIPGRTEIKQIVLFGSSLKNRKFNDVDFLILSDLPGLRVVKSLSLLKEKIERVFGVVLNLHASKPEIENLFRGIVIYQNSYLDISNEAKNSYFEFIDGAFESITTKDSRMRKTFFNTSVLNLAYAYCHLNDFKVGTKFETLEVFGKKYKINNIDKLKKTGVEIGKEIFK